MVLGKTMKVAILTAILGDFDTPIHPTEQELPDGVDVIDFHRFTDEDFPPVTGLSPRFQYRIPKMFGWQMFPGYDVYIWLDGAMSLQDPKSVEWLLKKLSLSDIAFFEHPWRKTIKEEVDHIETKLKEGNDYITKRYKNGFHKEQLEVIQKDASFQDKDLLASTVFIYKNNPHTKQALTLWWQYQSRYYTCDQVSLPYALSKSGVLVNYLPGDIFNNQFVSLVSKHK